ncbi:MAG: helix-turn-helix domain-containing protein [Phycisphaeraceae bacterium]|nr:helix-turn-helix domain-containing protein [Phycisphaerales bacterium]MCB9841687.1 helix-turn-helix domain-containing protein [Phycisphaeraceae bacterium]
MKHSPDVHSRQDARLTVNRREAARMLGISERLLWTLTNAGEVPHIRLGARVLYPVKALNEWIEERTSGADR